MANIAFVGLGMMGLPMAANLAKAGHRVLGFDLAEGARQAAGEQGLALTGTPAEAAREAEAVITMLPAGKHLIEAYRGPDGLLQAARPRSLFVDCSTVDIASARAAHEAARDAGMTAVDAPVSGGVGGAAAGTLTFMAGGEPDAVERARDLLLAMGKRIVHPGGQGRARPRRFATT